MRTLLALLLALGLVTGCSDKDDCTGRAYHEDLGQAGEKTPIDALDTWLDTHEGFDEDPPVDGWTVHDEGDDQPEAVVITNDDGDWWVSAVRTHSGGYVVDEATDDATDCADQLS